MPTMLKLIEPSVSPVSVEAVCVDPKTVHLVWPKVLYWIRTAMERGDLGLFDDVERDVLGGHSLLWLAWDGRDIKAAVITQLLKTECTKSCVIVACGGLDASRWSWLIERIEDYAIDEGCDAVRIFGRLGWQKILPEYRIARIVLERRL